MMGTWLVLEKVKDEVWEGRGSGVGPGSRGRDRVKDDVLVQRGVERVPGTPRATLDLITST